MVIQDGSLCARDRNIFVLVQRHISIGIIAIIVACSGRLFKTFGFDGAVVHLQQLIATVGIAQVIHVAIGSNS